METSNSLTGQESNQLTLFAVDTLASLSVPPANETVQMTQDIYGPGLSEPLANYDPDMHSWRMYEGICLWDLPMYLQTLLPSGMTRNGVLYQQPVWERITGENESSLWPTPTTVDAPTQPSRANPNLSDAARMRPNLSELPPTMKEFRESRQIWPTPISSSGMAEDISTVQARLVNGTPYKSRLVEAVAKWPTPTFGKLAGGTGGYNMIQELYLTQQISDEERRSMQAGNGGKLNPTWVEWLMGFPAGWTDLDA